MCEPVKPVTLRPNKGETRPLFSGWMVSGRGHAVGGPEFRRAVAVVKKAVTVFWVVQKPAEVDIEKGSFDEDRKV